MIFLTVNYTMQNIGNWYSNMQKDVQEAKELPAKDVGTKKTNENVKDGNAVILQQVQETKDNNVWQIELPKFRTNCTNQQWYYSRGNG